MAEIKRGQGEKIRERREYQGKSITNKELAGSYILSFSFSKF